MSKEVHFTEEQLDYLKVITPPLHVTVDSKQSEFIHNVIVSQFHAKVEAMRVRLHKRQRGG